MFVSRPSPSALKSVPVKWTYLCTCGCGWDAASTEPGLWSPCWACETACQPNVSGSLILAREVRR